MKHNDIKLLKNYKQLITILKNYSLLSQDKNAKLQAKIINLLLTTIKSDNKFLYKLNNTLISYIIYNLKYSNKKSKILKINRMLQQTLKTLYIKLNKHKSIKYIDQLFSNYNKIIYKLYIQNIKYKNLLFKIKKNKQIKIIKKELIKQLSVIAKNNNETRIYDLYSQFQKIQALKSLKQIKKIKYKLYIHVTANNTIYTLTNINNKTIFNYSTGKQYKKSKKSTKHAIYTVATYIGKMLKRRNINNIGLYVKGYGNAKKAIISAIRKNEINILQMFDNNPKPHNGCRLRKKPRK